MRLKFDICMFITEMAKTISMLMMAVLVCAVILESEASFSQCQKDCCQLHCGIQDCNATPCITEPTRSYIISCWEDTCWTRRSRYVLLSSTGKCINLFNVCLALLRTHEHVFMKVVGIFLNIMGTYFYRHKRTIILYIPSAILGQIVPPVSSNKSTNNVINFLKEILCMHLGILVGMHRCIIFCTLHFIPSHTHT